MAEIESEAPRITIRTMDDTLFQVEKSAVITSELITSMFPDDDEEEEEIPLPNVDSQTFQHVLNFLDIHGHDEDENATIFVEQLPTSAQVKLFMAATYLEIYSLSDICAKHLASSMMNIDIQNLYANMNIMEDLTPEEEAVIINQTKWADLKA